MFAKVTEGIRIEVQPLYIPEESNPREQRFFFAYRVMIQNIGSESVQLLNRHWIILDNLGNSEEVKGPGVVGKQPTLPPGTAFEYTSYCPLRTPTGSMRGTYEFIRTDGSKFLAEIPEFDLIKPDARPTLH